MQENVVGNLSGKVFYEISKWNTIKINGWELLIEIGTFYQRSAVSDNTDCNIG